MQAGGKRRGCALENHEPSSPKVTCIGQVRVKKTVKHGSKLKTLSPRHSDGEDRNRHTSSCVAVFERWWFVRIEGGKGRREIERDKKPEMIMEEARVSICIPPKNALLMMRYRSDPVKMAALSSRLFQTPVHVPEENGIHEDDDDEDKKNGGASVHEEAQADAHLEKLLERRKSHDFSLIDSNLDAADDEREEKQPSSSSPLPDCLLLMICEPKLSMEVSKETWVCSTDFDRRLPERRRPAEKPCMGPEQKKRVSNIPQAPAPPLPNESVLQPSRSSCTLPPAAYEPFLLTRCKSVPMKTLLS